MSGKKLISLENVLQMTFVDLHDGWFDVQAENERTTDTVRKLPARIYYEQARVVQRRSPVWSFRKRNNSITL